jgi:hypothetical protein
MVVVWPNTGPDAVVDWIEFNLESSDDEGNIWVTKYRVNVSFMKSRWACRFGSCPGVLITGANTDLACCQIGVHIEKGEDIAQVRRAVKQLTAEDADNYAEITGEAGWYYKIPRKAREKGDQYMYHTRLKDGGCIFVNRADGPTGKPGCSLHVLADRLGLHHSDTKPKICWAIPFGTVEEAFDENDKTDVVTITGTNASIWGAVSDEHLVHAGYWCTETPDAYNGGDEVYVSAEVELRKLLTDRVYEAMAEILSKTERRFPMPGEAANGGRPMLPLLVKDRVARWEAEGDRENLGRSQRYLDTN